MFNARLKKRIRSQDGLRTGTRLMTCAVFILRHNFINRIHRLSNRTTCFRTTGSSFISLLVMLTLLMFTPAQYSFASEKKPQPFVVSGVIINSHNADLIERFAQYLSKQSGYPLQVVYVNKYAQLSRVLRENPKAVGWTCGAPYVQDSETNGQKLVAVPLFNKKPTYHSLVLTRRDRPEKTLADFKNGVLAY